MRRKKSLKISIMLSCRKGVKVAFSFIFVKIIGVSGEMYGMFR